MIYDNYSLLRWVSLLLLSLARKVPRVQPLSFSSSLSSSSGGSTSLQHVTNLPDVRAAVIVPGFLSGADDFKDLADSLTIRGYPTVIVPMPRWHWIPCLGGRSMRPMLERIDYAVRHLSARCSGAEEVDDDANNAEIANKTTTAFLSKPIPDFSYDVFDCYEDFRSNPGGVLEVGGSCDVDEYPIVTPRGKFPEAPEGKPKGRVALIGHSAGGWISRLYLSNRTYGGRAYDGQELVHTLITLGTPHGNAPGAAFKGVEWCNREPIPRNRVRALAVAGEGFLGDRSGQLTQNSYAFCCSEGSDGTGYNGDGVTPIQSALAMEGSDQMKIKNAHHFPWSDVTGGDFFAPDLAKLHRQGMSWYGSGDAIDQWFEWLNNCKS